VEVNGILYICILRMRLAYIVVITSFSRGKPYIWPIYVVSLCMHNWNVIFIEILQLMIPPCKQVPNYTH